MIEIDLNEEQAQLIASRFLRVQLILNKQYWSDETKEHFLYVIKCNTSLMEWEAFLVQYERAHG